MKKWFVQFISYFFVGGISACVEWVSFYLLNSFVFTQYQYSTIMAFCLSTNTNYFLGKKIAFKVSSNRKNAYVLVFGVSAVGLFFNILFMYIFVDVMKWEALFSKIISTGMVFFWNFISRKYFIYK